MRIAVTPLVGMSGIWSESGWLMHWLLVKVWHELIPDAFMYVMVPDGEDKEKLPSLPRVKYIFEKRESVWYDNEVTFTPEFMRAFNPRYGKWPIDCLTTSKTSAALQCARMLWDYRCSEGMIPVFNHELKVVASGKAHQIVNDSEVVSRLMGYWKSWPIFNSEMEKQDAIIETSKFLTATLTKSVMGKAQVFSCGVSCRELDAAIKDVPKNDKFSAIFAGRLNWGSKRAPLSMELLDNFFAFGRDVRVIVSTPSSMKPTWDLAKEYPSLEIDGRVPTWEFWKKAAGCHAFVSFSQVEGFTVGVMEMLYMGILGVLPRRPWLKGLLLDKFDDYPFLHSNETEALACLRYIYENYEEAKKKVAWVPDFVRERYDAWKTAVDEYHYMQDVVKKTNVGFLWSPSNVELIQKTAQALGDTFNLDDFWQTMIKDSPVLKRLGTDDHSPVRGQPSRWSAWKWLLAHGYRDTCQTEVPVLVKTE